MGPSLTFSVSWPVTQISFTWLEWVMMFEDCCDKRILLPFPNFKSSLSFQYVVLNQITVVTLYFLASQKCCVWNIFLTFLSQMNNCQNNPFINGDINSVLFHLKKSITDKQLSSDKRKEILCLWDEDWLLGLIILDKWHGARCCH